jgi:hypothetical protein
LFHIAQRVLADNPLTAAMRRQIEDLMAAIPYCTLDAFTDPAAPDMPGWHDYVRPYLDQNWLQVPWFFAETYFYRRLIAITDFFRTGFDPFAAQKQQGLHTTVARGALCSLYQVLRWRQAPHTSKVVVFTWSCGAHDSITSRNHAYGGYHDGFSCPRRGDRRGHHR